LLCGFDTHGICAPLFGGLAVIDSAAGLFSRVDSAGRCSSYETEFAIRSG
jgi:hypothetical protein